MSGYNILHLKEVATAHKKELFTGLKGMASE